MAACAHARRLHRARPHRRFRVPHSAGLARPDSCLLGAYERAAACRGVRLLRDLPRALRARSACALAQMDDRPSRRERGGGIRRGAARRRRIVPVSWLDERTAGGRLTANNVLGVYSLVFFALAMVSLALNAFGPPDVRRKTRVILFGMLVGLLPIMALQVTIGHFRRADPAPAGDVLGAVGPVAVRHPALARLRRGEAPRDGDSRAAAPQRALPAGAARPGDAGHPRRASP